MVTTGEGVARAWYDDDGGHEVMQREQGAVGTRVSTSFLRFGQFEIFSQRDELPLLKELAEHALKREFNHLRVQHPEAPLSAQLVRMFEEICERQAHLISTWLRVGYCQGNMNSDNSALGGVTLDYGPFGFMERFQVWYGPHGLAPHQPPPTRTLAPPTPRRTRAPAHSSPEVQSPEIQSPEIQSPDVQSPIPASPAVHTPRL